MVAEKCAELDDVDYAVQLTDAIEDHGMQAQALERVAVQLAEKGDYAKAGSIADGMMTPDYVYAAVAARQSVAGDEETALQTLEMIDFPSAGVAALQAMASANLPADKHEKAVEYL